MSASRQARLAGVAVAIAALVAITTFWAAPGAGAGSTAVGQVVAPSITVTPATGLVNGQIVTLSGAGWAPETDLNYCQAKVDIDSIGPETCGFGRPVVTTDEQGSFSTTLTVYGVSFTGSNYSLDCTLAPGVCVVGVAAVTDVAGSMITTPLTFTPVPGPTITVTPSVDLLDGQTVTVSGTGFPDDATAFSLVECKMPPNFDCSDQTGALVYGSGGSFTADYTLARRPFGNLGPDCAAGPGACFISVFSDGTGNGYDTQFLSFQDVASAPDPPTILSATPIPSRATVSWTAPRFDGGSPILGYVVTPYIGTVSQGPRYFPSTATIQTVTGLADGTAYKFRVRAWNAAGVSAFSKVSNAVVPGLYPPGAPTIGTASAGAGQATVSWTAPASDGGSPILGYVVTPYIFSTPQGPRYFVSSSTTQTIGGLHPGTYYTFRVRAWSAAGVSTFSGATNRVAPTA